MENTGTNAPVGGYGYEEHVAKESAFVFGLNAGNVRLTKFAHTMHGGKDGAELEALDIMFTIDGVERGYRRFPIQKAYVKGENGAPQTETEDPNHPAFRAAQAELSQVLVHIVGCFRDKTDIKNALARPIASFKEYSEILKGLLPVNFADTPLDAFGQYQWQIKGDAKVTYLEFPKNMKHGRWLEAAHVPKDKWEKQQKLGASTGETALRYVDADGKVHPFARNGWYMESNFATQQKEAPSAGAAAMQSAGTTSGDW